MSVSTLDNLKKEAKRWLKTLRANDADARARLMRAYPDAPAQPVLRHVQHALAREHGFENWTALTTAVTGAPAHPSAAPDSIVSTFLEFACWDHHTHGTADHRMHDRAAQRLLAQHPAIARHSLYTAVVCGEIDEVARIVRGRSAAAREPGGARGWTPLLYLAYTRFTHPRTLDNALEIARLLIDHGANPNDFYMAGDSEYSCLVGAAGEGEQSSPRQPYATALYTLLLERGAGPYDIQVLYNTHFSGDMLWWLEPTYQRSLATGRKADWDDPHWHMLDMGGYGTGAHFVLKVALENENMALAEWALAHGADPNSDASSHPKFRLEHTLYDTARLRGLDDFAALLQRHGGKTSGAPLPDDVAFVSAVLRLDRTAARAMVEAHPEYLRSHRAMFEAASRDRPDAIALLLELGVPLEIEDRTGARALHHAAGNDAVRAARFLIDRGAEIDPRESSWGATPIGWAAHGDNAGTLDLLSRYTRNVWTLAFRGYVDRLRDVLRAEPDLAKQVTPEGITPLWWLPDDEAKAMEVVDLLLAAGADPAVTSREGRTAADWARKRGMTEIARRLGDAGGAEGVEGTAQRGGQTEHPAALERFERLAQDLLFAFERGNPDSMQRLMRHFGGDLTWAQLRAAVRQRLQGLGETVPEGYFALPHARMLIARQSGFDSWAALVSALRTDEADPTSPPIEPIAPPPPGPPDVPIEMRAPFTMRLHDHSGIPTPEVWRMLTACRDGDLRQAAALVTAWPTIIRAAYNSTTPLHLAVREGHVEIVRYLAGLGAVNPQYVTYPYKESLQTMAEDRGYDEIASILQEHARTADPDRPADESGHIEYATDFERRRFERVVGANAVSVAEEMLNRRPELATDPYAFWSEGILMSPAGNHHRAMIELLMKFGARVPKMTKWGASHYFKHEDLAAFFLDRGMDANHMNCHRTTLLHEMARTGELAKAKLLLRHGADIDAVDEEFRSTPLGFAARWGQADMIRMLLRRQADPTRSGAPWATPLAWARRKGHAAIARALEARSSG